MMQRWLAGNSLLTIIAMLLVLFGTGQRVRAQDTFCEVALVLAIDASSSVNEHEYRLQMEGTASALLDPEVRDAILSLGGVYISGFEWNGQSNQSMLFDWTHVVGEADISRLARQIVNHDRNTTKAPTALGNALGYAHRLMARAPIRCLRQVIDVSGDGISNDGIRPEDVYQLYDFSEITVNGLAILNPYRRGKTFYEAVDEYYMRSLLRGPGAFMIVAEGFDDFARAMKVKLLNELAPSPVGSLDRW